ncbi:MAG: DoxX-like family protein [Pseudomonadota bacterium]|nr:DoxX-like family protein [Pseudomonadota bacterium]
MTHPINPAPAPTSNLLPLRLSLVAVWLWTALVSLIEWNGQSLQLLHAGGVTSPALTPALIGGGAALDAALGIALWRWPRRAVFVTAFAATLFMTTIATALLPALWLHPLGPLSKNLPILAALWLLWSAEPGKKAVEA